MAADLDDLSYWLEHIHREMDITMAGSSAAAIIRQLESIESRLNKIEIILVGVRNRLD